MPIACRAGEEKKQLGPMRKPENRRAEPQIAQKWWKLSRARSSCGDKSEEVAGLRRFEKEEKNAFRRIFPEP